MRTKITVSAEINSPIEKVWSSWTQPKHIVNWNFASDDWRCPSATNDLRIGGKFSLRMESADGKMGFDFEGEYNAVQPNELIEYTITDGRKVKITFETLNGTVLVTEEFEAENMNSIDLQRSGWQAILNSFKKYTESLQNF